MRGYFKVIALAIIAAGAAYSFGWIAPKDPQAATLLAVIILVAIEFYKLGDE